MREHVGAAAPALFRPRFPSAELVSAAGALLTSAPRWDGCEGPRVRVVIGPGVVQVARRDPARAMRAEERQLDAARTAADLRASYLEQGLEVPDQAGPSRITAWSRKSRANMVRTLAALDYAPMFAAGGRPAMVTLTYPGEWEQLVPDAERCREQVKALRRRFLRAWGRPMVGIWKREFQRRGAPHLHIWMVPPDGEVNGQRFRAWLSAAWADIVGAQGVQRHRHELAGTGVDTVEGERACDPRRLAVYFSKHGAYAAKEYQNEAPGEWQASGKGVGRFWGVWGLDKALSAVEVTPAEGTAAARTMRRWARANGYTAQRDVWRYSQARVRVDQLGMMTRSGWHRRKVTRPVKRMRAGDAGFLTVNDGPAWVSQLARYLDLVHLWGTGEVRGGLSLGGDSGPAAYPAARGAGDATG